VLLVPASGATAPAGFRHTDPYVLRYWTAVLGPGAVADLLRLAQAGRRGTRLRRPVHLRHLIEAGLVGVVGRAIVVPDRVPVVPPELVAAFPAALRREHSRIRLPAVEDPKAGEEEGDHLPDQEAQSYPRTHPPSG
jgi:hypothetical protein